MSLEDIKVRAEAATEGPWQARQVADSYDSASDCQLVIGAEAYIHGCSDADRADAEFIAHARTDIPKLVAALEAVENLCDASTKLAGDTHRPFVMAESLRIAIREYLR